LTVSSKLKGKFDKENRRLSISREPNLKESLIKKTLVVFIELHRHKDYL
jgi:hypothetical protein